MELLFVTIIGAGIGALVRYLLPDRVKYGSLLLPSIAAAVTAALWVGLLWLGWRFDGGWIWVVSLVAGGIAALATALTLPKRRIRSDARMLAQLSGGKA